MALLSVLVAAPACGGSRPLNEDVKEYIEQSPPDETVIGSVGKVKAVRCVPTNRVYRDATVYVCDVTYDRALTQLCAVRVDGDVLTPRETRRMPCPIR